MKKRMLLLKRSLKTLLFLAVLSICSPNVWAQGEIKTGMVRLKYLIPTSPVRDYLGDGFNGIIRVNNMINKNIFQIVPMNDGRYLMALGYEETKEYSKGRFLYSNVPVISDEYKDNCLQDPDNNGEGNIKTIEALRIDDILYVTFDQQIDDISKLDELVIAGKIQKINLSEINNFVFFLESADFDFDNVITITSEIGGSAVYDLLRGNIKLISGDLSPNMTNMFLYETVNDPNKLDNILYRRLDFGKGDTPYTLEFLPLRSSHMKLFENSGEYLNQDGPTDTYNADLNKYVDGEYKRDSLGNVLSFLGINNHYQYGESTNYSFYVDTAYINRGTGLIKPQYMLAVNTYIPETDAVNGKYVIARYLYNTSMYSSLVYEPEYANKYYDKSKGEGIQISENETESGYLFKSNNFNTSKPVDILKVRDPNGAAYKYQTYWDRLAFAWAIHKGDSLYVLKGINFEPAYNGSSDAAYQLWMTLSSEYGVEGKSIDFSKLISENIIPESEYKEAYYPLGDESIYPEMRTYYDYKPAGKLSQGKTVGLQAIVALNDNTHKDWVFSLRLTGEIGVNDFTIELETIDRDTRFGSMINPGYGGWLRFADGIVPAISRSDSWNLLTDPDMLFNVRQTEKKAVNNDAININNAQTTIIGGTGNVTILNAVNKNVIISDVLGRIISNSIASSDYISIAAPSGIIFVSIDGEKATKVLVK